MGNLVGAFELKFPIVKREFLSKADFSFWRNSKTNDRIIHDIFTDYLY